MASASVGFASLASGRSGCWKSTARRTSPPEGSCNSTFQRRIVSSARRLAQEFLQPRGAQAADRHRLGRAAGQFQRHPPRRRLLDVIDQLVMHRQPLGSDAETRIRPGGEPRRGSPHHQRRRVGRLVVAIGQAGRDARQAVFAHLGSRPAARAARSFRADGQVVAGRHDQGPLVVRERRRWEGRELDALASSNRPASPAASAWRGNRPDTPVPAGIPLGRRTWTRRAWSAGP